MTTHASQRETKDVCKINLNTLSTEQNQAFARSTYDNANYFESKFQCEEMIINCNKHTEAFQQHIIRILIEKSIIKHPMPLDTLHSHLPEELTAYDFAHGVNKISEIFYETDDALHHSYLSFIRFIRETTITEPFYFQATPTIRIHCPKSTNADLYPRYHTDICYGHPPEEVNIWIPLTAKNDGHGFSLIDLKQSHELFKKFHYDYPDFIKNATYDRNFSSHCEALAHPAEVELGEALLFDPRLIHSGEPLKNHTRISIDTRIYPVSKYNTSNIEFQGSGRLKILFEPGHCYDHKDSEAL